MGTMGLNRRIHLSISLGMLKSSMHFHLFGATAAVLGIVGIVGLDAELPDSRPVGDGLDADSRRAAVAVEFFGRNGPCFARVVRVGGQPRGGVFQGGFGQPLGLTAQRRVSRSPIAAAMDFNSNDENHGGDDKANEDHYKDRAAPAFRSGQDILPHDRPSFFGPQTGDPWPNAASMRIFSSFRSKSRPCA